MARSAFVTGGTGFIGVNLVEQLSAEGWNVTALHRPSSDVRLLKRFPVTLVEGDVTDAASVVAAMPDGVDAVFHLAGDLTVGSGHNEQQERINVLGTRNVVEAALARKAGRLVHTSSISAWGQAKGRIDESMPQRGDVSRVSYHRTKWRSEQEVREGIERGLDAVILNPATVLGRYARGGWAGLVVLLAAGKLVFMPPGAMSFSHGAAVARAHIDAVARGRAGENYLLGGADASLKQFVETAAAYLGIESPKRVAAPALLLARGWAEVLLARVKKGHQPTVTPDSARFMSRMVFVDCTKAVEDLGYQPASLDTIVRDTCDWLREAGALPR